mmetsp:Transcript_48896/g.140501  ORF Transcript_48896/g.140501 Transcript_48896/m.140501 type:complete len:211 (+) Transcript_48896:285-917(+)
MWAVTSVDAHSLCGRIQGLHFVRRLGSNPRIILSPAKKKGTFQIGQEIVNVNTRPTSILSYDSVEDFGCIGIQRWESDRFYKFFVNIVSVDGIDLFQDLRNACRLFGKDERCPNDHSLNRRLNFLDERIDLFDFFRLTITKSPCPVQQNHAIDQGFSFVSCSCVQGCESSQTVPGQGRGFLHHFFQEIHCLISPNFRCIFLDGLGTQSES